MVGVAVELHVGDLDGADPMSCRGAAWKCGPVSLFDEEGERGLGSGLLDARQAPSHEPAVSSGA